MTNNEYVVDSNPNIIARCVIQWVCLKETHILIEQEKSLVIFSLFKCDRHLVYIATAAEAAKPHRGCVLPCSPVLLSLRHRHSAQPLRTYSKRNKYVLIKECAPHTQAHIHEGIFLPLVAVLLLHRGKIQGPFQDHLSAVPACHDKVISFSCCQ